MRHPASHSSSAHSIPYTAEDSHTRISTTRARARTRARTRTSKPPSPKPYTTLLTARSCTWSHARLSLFSNAVNLVRCSWLSSCTRRAQEHKMQESAERSCYSRRRIKEALSPSQLQALAGIAAVEIGRESRRERVCQSV